MLCVHKIGSLPKSEPCYVSHAVPGRLVYQLEDTTQCKSRCSLLPGLGIIFVMHGNDFGLEIYKYYKRQCLAKYILYTGKYVPTRY